MKSSPSSNYLRDSYFIIVFPLRNTLNKYGSQDGELGLIFSLFGTSSLSLLSNFIDPFKACPPLGIIAKFRL